MAADGRPDDMIACDYNSGAGARSSITQTLGVGTYYVVVRAHQSELNTR